MSKERFCPECGQVMETDERFCRDCGAEVPCDPVKGVAAAEAILNGVKPPEADASVIGAGARANITGGINKTSTTHANINTSHVDNSATVHNNTTIVMGKEETEYCEVCGNPFGEKNARCPKCGKKICFDCKVKNKNRCVECEKKAVNEYSVAFQQLLLTTSGNIGVAGRQMMNQKARELDVEDAKAGIEQEMNDLYKPENKAVQPAVTSATTASFTSQPAKPEVSEKGVGALTGKKPLRPTTDKGKNRWVFVAIALLVVFGGYFMFGKKGDAAKEVPVAPSVEQKQEVAKPPVPAAQPKSTPPAKTEKPVEQAEQVEQVKQPAVKKKDPDYDAGMVAFNKGEGLEAIRLFNKSGSADSFHMLGLIYESGCGSVGANAMMARKNFKKAADMGKEEAKAKL